MTPCGQCVQYTRGAEAAGGPSGRGRHDAGVPGSITIGGSGNVRSRFALRSQEVGSHLAALSVKHHSLRMLTQLGASQACATQPVQVADSPQPPCRMTNRLA